MNTVRSGLRVTLVLLGMMAAVVLPAQETQPAQRGFLFQIGLGGAYVSYGPSTDAMLSLVTSYGLTRIDIALDLGAGWAVTQDMYALALIDGFATRIGDNSNYIQVNSYLYGGGIRVYPFHTGLVLGVDGGVSVIVVESSVDQAVRSPAGWGAAISAAYDFNGKTTGFSLIVGVKAHYLVIESDQVTAVALYADFCWK